MPLELTTAGLSIRDPDDTGADATLRFVCATGTFTATVGDSGLVITSGNGTGDLLLTGTIQEFYRFLKDATTGTLQFGSSTEGVNSVTITATDSTGQASTTTITITVVDNDAPVVTYGGSNKVGDIGVSLEVTDANWSVTDADNETAELYTVTLTVAAGGSLTVDVGDSGMTLVSGNGSVEVELTGTLVNINAFLQSTGSSSILFLRSATAGNYTVTVDVEDANGLSDSAALTAEMGNQPVVTGPTTALALTTDASSNLHGIGWTVSDADDGGGTATAVLNTTLGTISVAAGDSGVTVVSGSGTDTVTLTGTITQLNGLFTDAGTGTITTISTGEGSGVITFTVTDSTSRVGSDTQNVTCQDNTAEWTFYATATPEAPTITLNDFTALIDLSRLPSSWWTAVTSDGRDIRVTNASNANYPRDLISFNKTARTGLVAFKLNLTTSPGAVRVWCGSTGATAPAAGDTYGQYNAYSTDMKGFWPDGAGNDRTTNANNFTPTGGYTAGDAQGPVALSTAPYTATTLNGTTQYGRASAAVGNASTFLLGGFFKSDNTTPSNVLIAKAVPNENENAFVFHYNKRKWVGQRGSGVIASAQAPTADVSSGVWHVYGGYFAGSTRRVAIGGSGGVNTATVATDYTDAEFQVGALLVNGSPTLLFDGQVSLTFALNKTFADDGVAWIDRFSRNVISSNFWGTWQGVTGTVTGL